MAARPMWAAGGRELDRLPGVPVQPIKPYTPGINPLGGSVPGAGAVANPLGGGLSVVPRGGVENAATVTPSITPIGRFAIVLLLFSLAVFFLPKGTRGWFVLIILLGALTVNEGAIQEFTHWSLGK